MVRGRSYRRKQLVKIKNKVKFVIEKIRRYGEKRFYIPLGDREIGKEASTHCKSCSCPMCGNPRKYFKKNDALTKQEKIADISEKEQKEEGE